MTKIDLFTHDATIEALIHVFLQHNPTFTIKNNEIEWEGLSMEGALLVRVYCEYCSQAMDEERIEQLIPTLSQWVDLTDSYKLLLQESQDDKEILEYIVRQMLKTIPFLNLSDESGRQKLLRLLRSL